MKVRERAWRFELSFTTKVEMLILTNANVQKNPIIYVLENILEHCI